MHFFSVGFLGLWLWCFWRLCKEPTMLNSILAGLCLHVLNGVGHNFMHKRDAYNPLRFCFDLPIYSSTREWRVSHCISHHHWPNTEIDVEASGTEPFLRFIRTRSAQGYWIYVSLPIFYTVLPLILFVRVPLMLLADANTRKEFGKNVLGFMFPYLELAALWFGNSEGFGWCFLCFLVMHTISFYMLILLSIPVHRGTRSWSTACSVIPPRRRWISGSRSSGRRRTTTLGSRSHST